MTGKAQGQGRKPAPPARTLMFSQRNIFPNVHYRLGLYEFEDSICDLDAVDMIAPAPARRFTYGTRMANRLAANYNWAFNPGIPADRVSSEYDLFLAIVQFPKDLLHVEALRDWKRRCRVSLCWMNELWLSELHKYRYFLRLLDQFDYVVVHWAGSVRAVQERVSGRCFYLPYGVDALLFCPCPNPPQRHIDVYSIGRRSEPTHQALLKLVDERGLFYVYDTIQGSTVSSAREHRALVANIAKRSRYFLVNPGKVDSPDETFGQIEFGNRFFEGAAAGTIMIGQTPTNEQFGRVFDWEGAVVHLPYGSPEIGHVIDQLECDPERQANIRTKNVIESLRRHDWAYRWESILHTVGMEPLPALERRQQRLETMAAWIESERLVGAR
jgi:hypothetical protein